MEAMPLGIYVSVPFCRTKCSYCNFASDVSSHAVFETYVDRLCADIADVDASVAAIGGVIEREVDSIYLGGGTPTALDVRQLRRIFSAIRSQFDLQHNAEITVECAPGTLAPGMIDCLLACGVNRVSLGVQSFVDGEAAVVGRLHKRATVIEEIASLGASGITNINIDLIAGLPHQTPESWRMSLEETVAAGVPHTSVYMLEVDEDSRLGRELIAGGTRYHAHFVPHEDAIADFYLEACERLDGAGVRQYEISNFAHAGLESLHNLKYWTRQPYLGFGVDAHSMLRSSCQEFDAVRFATADSLEKYLARAGQSSTAGTHETSLEETFFLGLRLTRGVSLHEVAARFGEEAVARYASLIGDMVESALIECDGARIRLTSRGRLLSNEVFQRFLAPAEIPG